MTVTRGLLKSYLQLVRSVRSQNKEQNLFIFGVYVLNCAKTRSYFSVRLFFLNMWSSYPTLFTRYFMKRYLLITHYDIMSTRHKRCPSAIGKHTHYANCNPSRRSLTKHNPQANNRIANDYNVIVGLFIARICSNNDKTALWRLVESAI